jgi:Zn-dependent peptidase ImmA (M78 family)/DNA-binding XRE family transcriptional regulator
MASNIVSLSDRVPNSHRRLVPSRLKDARLACRLNQSDLAAAVEVSRQAISAFEQGEKSPDSTTMMRIAEILRQPVSFFVTEDRPMFGESSVRFFRAFGADTKRRNLMCEVLGKWSVQIARYFDAFIHFPKVDLMSSSPTREDGRYNDDEIELAAEECRRAWGLGQGPISNVISLLESKGIGVFRYEVPEEKISAFSFWNGPKPFVFLASDTSSAVRVRFDAAHELGHLILHRGIGPDELEDPKILKLIEGEANRFAGAFLLPRGSFPNEVFTTRLDSFLPLKARWKAAVQAMVVRCKQLEIFDEDQTTNLYKQISFRKWRTHEPLDADIQLEQPRLLSRAAQLIIEAGKKIGSEIQADLQVRVDFLAAVCNVGPDFFDHPKPPEIFPTLR